MSSTVDPGYLDILLEELRIVCLSLEEIGCSSLVIAITGDGPVAMGSQKGMQFLKDNSIITDEFYQHCQGDIPPIREAQPQEPLKVKLLANGKETIGVIRTKPSTRKSKKSDNSKTMSLNSLKMFPNYETVADDLKEQCEDFDGRDIETKIFADPDKMDDGRDRGEEHKDFRANAADDVDDNHENLDSGVKHKETQGNDNENYENPNSVGSDVISQEIQANIAADDDISDNNDTVGDGYSVLSELDHNGDISNEDVETDTKSSVTDRKIDKRKSSIKKMFIISEETKMGAVSQGITSVKTDLQDDSVISSCETPLTQMDFVCSECKESDAYSFLMLRDLKRHFKRKHQDLTVLKYTLCIKKQNAKSGEVHAEEILLGFCAECKQSSISRDKLSYHNHMLYNCLLCKRVFHCEQAFEKHKESESEFTSCNTCGKLLKISSVAQHKKYFCLTSVSKYKRVYWRNFLCNYCPESFQVARKLEEHISARHTKAVLYLCHICGLGFSSNGNVKQHIKLHENRNLWQCDLCSKYFTQVGNLKKHITKHLGLRLYQCNICKASFIQKGNLKKHLLVHSDERKHTCSYCGKSMKESKSLQLHVRQLHTKPQTYQCEHCNASFKWKCNLTAHLKNGICLKKVKK